ncbi:MAG: hypothetical protein NC548_30350 [Lachnospiraceae bacterium]|nr:hypothetical protein [Lachnospiraceae bacterium]
MEEKKNIGFMKDGEGFSLEDGVEFMAVKICEDLTNGKRTNEIMQKCKILDSLSNALIAVRK